MFRLKSFLLFSLLINVLTVNGQGKRTSAFERLFEELDRFEAVRSQSWDQYIDNLIEQSKDANGRPHVDKACIISIDGGGKWTTDNHPNAYKLSQTERTHIAAAFKAKDFIPFMVSGITAEGIKYNFLREEAQKTVYAKKKGQGAITLQASKTAVVIAHCPEGKQQGNANKAVAVIAEYLESRGM